MHTTRELHQLGQRLWLDHITRGILDDGTLRDYIEKFSITGLTSNPTIFDQAVSGTSAYDHQILAQANAGKAAEDILIELALDDLRRAADLFLRVHAASDGIDGWVSMEISPLLAADTAGSTAAATHIHALADRPNLLVKIPGTPEGLPAIEQAIAAGIPVNVTLLFSCGHYLAAAEAYLRGIERRIEANLDPRVASVASLFVSRWDKAVDDRVPAELRNRLGIAVAQRTYREYCRLLASPRWKRLQDHGARPQRLLWASTGTKDPDARDTLYVEALVAPDTINTMPEKTLRAFVDHGVVGGVLAPDGGDAEATLARFARAGIDVEALATQLQHEGAQAFVASWRQLLQHIASKGHVLTAAGGG